MTRRRQPGDSLQHRAPLTLPIDLLTTALADRYRILREAGHGGMATVHAAHDVKHDREVAIKVLSPELGAVLGVERFLTEIRTTAKFQHPNILPLYDSGTEAGLVFYVMPFVDGETLRERIVREGQLSIEDTVRIARGVASALDYAHKRGVIHRDIKPENILLQDGQPLVSDFGIALAISNAGGTRVTQTGISVGTPQYMSPEQAAAERQLDGRSDQYALASVVYELLAGEPPFTGPSAPVVMSRLMTEVPRAVNTRRPSVSPACSTAIARALSKVPADRYATATAFVDAMEGTGAATLATGVEARAATTSLARRMSLPVMAFVTVAALALAGWSWLRHPATPLAGTYRFTMPVSDSPLNVLGFLALSPDGRRVAMVITDSAGLPSIWIRSLDSLNAVRVIGSENALNPFFSPDGLHLGFFTEHGMRRVDVRGGQSTPIATLTDVTPRIARAIWMADDVIIFSANARGPLYRVSARGGAEPVAYTVLDSSQGPRVHGQPVRLSDNRHFLYRARFSSRTVNSPLRVIQAGRGQPGDTTFLASIDSPKATPVTEQNITASSANALLFLRDGEVRALPFDMGRLRVSGDPVSIVTGDTVQGYDASDNGILVYRSNEIADGNRLLWLDRTGKEIGHIGEHADGQAYDFYGPRISPDGKQVAYEYHGGRGGGDLFVYDAPTDKSIQETFDPTHHNAFVAWAPDSKRLIFQSTRAGYQWYLKTLDGTPERLIPTSVAMNFPSDWSSDGKAVFVAGESPGSGLDVFQLPPEGGAPVPVLKGPANEMQAALSPDGRWLAYTSDEQGGRNEVFVRRYPITAEQWRVSTDGGEGPRWRRDGKELFFLTRNPTGGVMVCAVTSGAAFSSSTPRLLFRRPIRMSSNGALRTAVNYDVSPDGARVVAVVLDSTSQARVPLLRVFANWPAVRPLKTP